jgi:hypothetical protein
MNSLLKKVLLAGSFILFIASPVISLSTPQTTYAAEPGGCENRVLGIPPWYRGLTKEDKNDDGSVDCMILSPNDVGGLSNFIWKIVLNVIELALVLASLIAVFYILYGGFLFITGGGNSSQVEKARKSILNAVIGLIISMGAIAITNLIFGVLGGATGQGELNLPQLTAEQLLQNSLNLVYYIAGIVAVVVIVVAGIMYATSLGDSGRVTRAKNMILYAVIGLAVLLAAFAITNFVIGQF